MPRLSYLPFMSHVLRFTISPGATHVFTLFHAYP
jgi:hypothetical protein